MTNRDALTARIVEAFSDQRSEMLGLFRIWDVVPTEAVETAAVECRTMPRLLINPGFVEKHANTSEKLLMLVLHELYHVLLGHTRQFARCTPAWNLALDAVINAMLCRTWLGPGHRALFTDYYSDHRFPECLLRPPKGWEEPRFDPSKERKPVRIPPGLRNPALKRFRPIYRALYSESGVDYQEVYDALTAVLPDPVLGVRLLGNHHRESALEAPGVLVKVVLETLNGSSALIARGCVGDVMQEYWLSGQSVERISRDRAELASLIRLVAATRHETHGRRRAMDSIEVCAPAPKPDRRSIVLRTLGCESLLHRTELQRPGMGGTNEPVHVYLDVSGSVARDRPALYAAVWACRDLVHPEIHLFSNQVHSLSLQQLRAGVCRTTEGTDIVCVAAHMRRHWIRRAVILTDGYVGKPAGVDAETLQHCLLGVALARSRWTTKHELQDYTNFWAQLRDRQSRCITSFRRPPPDVFSAVYTATATLNEADGDATRVGCNEGVE